MTPSDSETFDAAYRDRLKKADYGLVIVPIDGTANGQSSGSVIYFGTQARIREDGSVLMAAYLFAHEMGHQVQPFYEGHPEWNVSSNTAYESGIAGNAAEYYALKFANQVSADIQAKTGINIGSQANYEDANGAKREERGILPSSGKGGG